MATFSISATARKAQATGTGAAGPFSFAFQVNAQSELAVYVDDTLKTLTTHYTVTLNADGTGSITFTSGNFPTTSQTVTILGNAPLSRTSVYTSGGNITATALETDFDTNVMVQQQQQELLDRTMIAPVSDPSSINMTLPNKADRADKILKFNTEGNPEAALASSVFANTVVGANFTNNVFTGNGSTTAYTLTVAPGSKNNCQVYIDGVYQEKASFSINATTLTFTEAPPNNASIEAIIGNAIDTVDTDSGVVNYNQGGTGAQTRTVESRLRDFVSVKDFGAVGNGVTDDTAAIQAALTNAFNNGGGNVFVPAGEYITTSPLIIRSNVSFFGEGAASIIHNKQPVYTVACNVIHIGYGYEWNENGVSFDAGSNDDATAAQLLANDFSKIKAKNITVHDLTIKGTEPVGLGIWCMNAQNVVIDSIWSVDTRTPINIGNDASPQTAACHNVSVSNVFQVSALGASKDWYDLVFVGQAVNVSISRCFNNPNSPSTLDGMILSSGYNVTITDCNLQGDDTAGKKGILLIGGSVSTNHYVTINNNIVKDIDSGIDIFQIAGVRCSDNLITSCATAVTVRGKNNLIDSNLFIGNTTDLSGNSDATGNSFTNNRGMTTLTPWTVTSTDDYEEHNFFDGNYQPTTTTTSNTGYSGLKSRKVTFLPYEALLDPTDEAKLADKDAQLSLTSNPDTVDIYYRIPTDTRKLISVGGALYTTTASQTIVASIVGFNQFQNSSSLTTHESLGTYTTTSAGDQTYSFNLSTPTLYNNGVYYIKMVLTTTSGISFRAVTANTRVE